MRLDVASACDSGGTVRSRFLQHGQQYEQHLLLDCPMLWPMLLHSLDPGSKVMPSEIRRDKENQSLLKSSKGPVSLHRKFAFCCCS